MSPVPEGRDPDILRAEDVPGYGQGLNAFAERFDGYRHFGGTDVAFARTNSIRARWVESGELPASVDDLRACLWVAVRREKFVEFDDVFQVIGARRHRCSRARPLARDACAQGSGTVQASARNPHHRPAGRRHSPDLHGQPSDSRPPDAIARLETHPDRVLSISSAVVRADCDGIPVVAVGNDQSFGAQLNGLLDALHFHRVRYRGEGPLRYVVGRRREKGEDG